MVEPMTVQTISIDVSQEPADAVEALLASFVKLAELAEEHMPDDEKVNVFVSTGDGSHVELLQVPKRVIALINQMIQADDEDLPT